jgi:serine phosphatase RsbU (regulator of sigma subunit)
VLGALNSVLHGSESTQFVTVLCARLRPHPDGTHALVDLATAGHPAPLVLRADGRVDQVGVYGMAAGLVAEMRYGAVSLRLDHGDTMLMFTDGVDEARGTAGQYGLERLHALLPAYAGAAPEVICEVVEQDVMEYLDGRAHDDMALFAITCST